jgi:hypothetical protein
MRQFYPVIAYLALLFSGCIDKPVSLDQRVQEYVTLAQVVASEVQPGQIVNYEEAQGKLRQLMSELGVRRVRHERDGTFILLSGQSNIFTGQFSYLYKIGDTEIDLSFSPNDGVEREHLHGRWYIEKAYFD